MSKRKPIVVLLAILLAFGLFSASGFFQNAKAAEYGGESEPSVSVAAGGSITVSPHNMPYGSRQPGTRIAWDEGDQVEGNDHYVRLEVNTNTTTWRVECSKNDDLFSDPNHIISENFIYTSVVSGGLPADADVYLEQEFGTLGTPSKVTDPHDLVSPANALIVDVRYDLNIVITQAGADNYQAVHTYTLTAG